jgi:hypothetical protein
MDTLVLIRKVQRSFGDDNSIFIKQDDILDWINDAQLQIVRETNCLVEEAFVAANLFPWTLPDNFLKTARVLYGPKILSYVPVEGLDSQSADLSNVYVPNLYYFIKDQMRLYPNASTTDATSVTIQYDKMPVAITSTSEQLTVPPVYHEDIVRFCLARAHERNENYRGMEIAMQEFAARISDRIDESDVQDEAYSVIRDDPYWVGYS